MRLSNHADYGLRFLMIAATRPLDAVSVQSVATQIQVSPHHLMKVAQSLTRGGILHPVRGRSGGFQLTQNPKGIRIGEVIRALEKEVAMVECQRSKLASCPILPACRLPHVLTKATDAFFEVLNTYTLNDLVAENTQLFRLAVVKHD